MMSAVVEDVRESVDLDPVDAAASSVSPAREFRQRLRGPERRETLLDAAVAIIKDGDLADVTMERVANRVGVHKRVAYRFYANTDELLIDVFRRENDAATERALVAIGEATTLHDKMRALVRSYLFVLRTDRLQIPSFATAGRGGVLGAARKARVREIVELVAALLQSDIDLSDEIACAGATVFIYGLDGLIDLTAQHEALSEVDVQRLEDEFMVIADAAVAGLRARQSPVRA